MVDMVVNHVGYVDLNQTTGVTPFYNRTDFHDCALLKLEGLCDGCDVLNTLNLSNGIETFVRQNTDCRLSGLPDLNHTVPEVRETLINWVQSVFGTYAFSGARFDAVLHIPPVRGQVYVTCIARYLAAAHVAHCSFARGGLYVQGIVPSVHWRHDCLPAVHVPTSQQRYQQWLFPGGGADRIRGPVVHLVQAGPGSRARRYEKHGISQLSNDICNAQRICLGAKQHLGWQPLVPVRGCCAWCFFSSLPDVVMPSGCSSRSSTRSLLLACTCHPWACLLTIRILRGLARSTAAHQPFGMSSWVGGKCRSTKHCRRHLLHNVLYRNALTFTYFIPGIPIVFYGTEQQATGWQYNQSNRTPMWTYGFDEVNQFYTWVRMLNWCAPRAM